jgi:putative ABC transport system permease protein
LQHYVTVTTVRSLSMRTFLWSFAQAFQNIRANLFHTVLSVLGIIIGVGALVSILSFIDGLEAYAQKQITRTTNIKAVMITADTHRDINGLQVRKDSLQVLDFERFEALQRAVQPIARAILYARGAQEISVKGQSTPIGAMMDYTTRTDWPDSLRKEGQLLTDADMRPDAQFCVVNERLARMILGPDSTASAVGRSLIFQRKEWRIKGVVVAEKPSNDEEVPPKAWVPIATQSAATLREQPPTCFLEATTVEDVAPLKQRVLDWRDQTLGAAKEDLQVQTDEMRSGQAAQAFLIFRIIMGLIVGISVVVGGVGVMNVLLISVNERTPEIGLRKAMGATRKDIRQLFLAESIAVSVFGSFMGLLLGFTVTTIAIPIIRSITEVHDFEAAYTWQTVLTTSVVAILIGVIFGTWPAIKAARLDPVEAIRRE